ncbi:MAG: cytochrome c [Anaerolineae bacterium]|nr:cytochrome c [Anaerolineae bacterium]
MTVKHAPMLLTVLLLATLAACGTPATLPPPRTPTLVLPTRVPIQPTPDSRVVEITPQAQPTRVAVQPTATPTRVRPSPTPTITLIPPTNTPVPPTETPTPSPTPQPDPARGAVLFANGFAGRPDVPTCASCHYVEPVEVNDLVGPVMYGIADRAARRDPNEVSAVSYLRNSIIHPNKYLVPNEGDKVYAVGGMSLMHQNYAQELTPEEINDLVAYMLTLRAR